MPLILGLDIATVTGFAWYDTGKDLSAIEAGSFRIEGEGFEERAGIMGRKIVGLIRDRRPDFIGIERPTRNVVQHRKVRRDLVGQADDATTINAGTSMLLNQFTGAAVGVIAAYRVPYEAIAPETWRKQFLGFGRHAGWQRKDWKRAAREKCDQLRIQVSNDDAADAVGVAFAGASSQTFRWLTREDCQVGTD